MGQKNGLGSSKGLHADKVSLAHGKLDTEKKMLKMAARRLSSAASETQKKGRSKPAKSSGIFDRLVARISAKARHNKKQREFYKRRQKARKVQLVKLAESETVVGEASAAPSETGL